MVTRSFLLKLTRLGNIREIPNVRNGFRKQLVMSRSFYSSDFEIVHVKRQVSVGFVYIVYGQKRKKIFGVNFTSAKLFFYNRSFSEEGSPNFLLKFRNDFFLL